jgi:hypothetical protein
LSEVESCINDLQPRLADAIASKIVGQDDADLLLVQRSQTGRVWICAIRGEASVWHADAIEVVRPRQVATDFALSGSFSDAGEQEAYLRQSHRHFLEVVSEWMSWVGITAKPKLLRIKVDPREAWFLKFPLGLFAQLKLDGFQHYSGCQWIVTDRTICATVAGQRIAERDMADTSAFLRGAHIVINTYAAHERAGAADFLGKGFELALEILRQFHSISLNGETMSLRWTLNPPPDVLADILLSPLTRFLFADFEAAGNVWHIGDGPHKCWQPCTHPTRYTGEPRFQLVQFCDRLQHVVLMRIYHCNSIYDPHLRTVDPAGERTLAGRLLATGATFIEGSLSAETAPDFICELLRLLLGRSDLQGILWAKSIAGSFDLADFLKRANTLLGRRGYTALA